MIRSSALLALPLVAGLLAWTGSAAQQVDISSGSIVETVAKLKAGQYIWAPEAAPSGPMLLVVNLATQRATLFRNGVPIAASTISTGRRGYRTPTGIFAILQKHVEHYSSKYDNAPMPYMQRLTWYGVALHAGHLPGYPASHGCIRLPAGFAKLLYDVTQLGMTVVVTDSPVTPRLAPTPEMVLASGGDHLLSAEVTWHPELAPAGPVSIIVSAADRRATVLRSGLIIGSGPVTIDGPVTGSWVYTLRSVGADGQQWVRLQLSPNSKDVGRVASQEWQRFHAPESFRRAVASIVEPGTTIVVTPDSLQVGGSAFKLIEEQTGA